MTAQAGPSRRLAGNSGPKAAPDRRLHKRHQIVRLGRFMRASKHEYPCKLIDISVGGAAMMSPVAPEIGERIVAYFDGLGGLEGSVVRLLDGGFAVSFHMSQHKREKLAAQITWLINRQDLGLPEQRRHERFALADHKTTLKFADGVVMPCIVIDVSLSGASVGTNARPEIGTEVVLGRTRARVVRLHDMGIGVEFVDLQNAAALRRHFG